MKKVFYVVAATALLMAVTVSCNKNKVTSVQLNKTELTLSVGDTAILIASVLPKEANNNAVNWKSDNPTTVTVDNSGKVTAKAAGTATITVTTEDGNKTASCKVTVTEAFVKAEVMSVSLNKTELTLSIGETETLIASVLPENATNRAVSWKSSDNNVAQVDSNGKITAKDVGKALITATTNDGEKTATCTLTVIYGNIMDTLKGEWSWYKESGGFAGGTWDNEFKSIVKILSQNADSTINYEVFVEDTLFSKGSFQIIVSPFWRKVEVIELPHYSHSNGWGVYFGNYLGDPTPSKDTLVFWVIGNDTYHYHYKRIK